MQDGSCPVSHRGKTGKMLHGFLFRRMEVSREDMYVNSGYLFNSRVPFKEKKMALRILSAGTYQLYTWPRLPTWRPKGRVDWQLIYVAAGEGHFVLDGQEVIVPAGNMVLYQPKQEQRYFFLGKDSSQYWFEAFSNIMKSLSTAIFCIPGFPTSMRICLKK